MNLLTRLACLVRGRRIDRELDEELQAHLQQLIAQNIAEGMPREDAESAARRHFGDTLRLRERDQDARGWRWLEDTVRDIRFAFRSLTHAPGYALATTATLAVGVGITTAVAVYAWPVLFPAIPVPVADRAVVISNNTIALVPDAAPYPWFSFTSRFAFLRDNTTSLALLGGIRNESANLVIDGDPSSAQIGWITQDYFELIGARPAIGRLFLADEYSATGHTPAVLSWSTWQNRLGGSPDVIGRTLMVNGAARTVVGVLPREFQPPPQFFGSDLYLPARPEVTDPFLPFSWMQVLGRLKPGITREQASVELNTLVVQAPPVIDPAQREKVALSLIPVSEYYRTARVFWLFAVGVVFLYAIACTNAANLMLARVIARRRELGIRMALGGGRWRMVRLLFAETLLLGAVAGLGAYAVALASVRLFVHAHGGDADSGLFDAQILGVAMGLSVLTGLIVAAIPGARLGHSQTHDVMKEGSGSLGDSRRLSRLRAGLVVMQAALAVVLLIGAGLALQNFRRLTHADLGFDPLHKIAVTGTLPPDLLNPESFFMLTDRFRVALAGLPGVRRVIQASSVPFSSATGSLTVQIDGHPEFGDLSFYRYSVTADYFEAMGVPLLEGHGFSDTRVGDAPVVVINELAAKRYFPDGSALGRHLDADQFGRWEIVGIARDVRQFGPHDERQLQAYIPMHQPPIATSIICAMIQMDDSPPAGFDAMVRRAAYAADPRLAVRVEPIAERMHTLLNADRRNATVFGVLSVLALTLASTGLFAVMAYTVAQRQREFGVRAALGATRTHLQRAALSHGLGLGVAGTLIGLAAAAGLARFMQSALHEMSAYEPSIYVAVAVLQICIATLACWIPARRAARADPLKLLRTD